MELKTWRYKGKYWRGKSGSKLVLSSSIQSHINGPIRINQFGDSQETNKSITRTPTGVGEAGGLEWYACNLSRLS